MGLFSSKDDKSKYLKGFAKTNNSFANKLRALTSKKNLDKKEFLEQLMITLIEADFGYTTAKLICDKVAKENSDDNLSLVTKVIEETYNDTNEQEIILNENATTVIMLVGVNGSGKTSTCAKLANKFIQENKAVALVAADTFRAGAREQLLRWAERLNIHCVTGKDNQDPSSVLVDGCIYAKENNIDVLICDTAGRLQNKVNLMNELEKMKRVVSKQIEGAPHNTWLVLDANTGQNGLSQAELFNEITNLNGIVLTKIDGTSKGGIIVGIKNTTNVPVRFITFGEDIESISKFDLKLYLESITKELTNAS